MQLSYTELAEAGKRKAGSWTRYSSMMDCLWNCQYTWRGSRTQIGDVQARTSRSSCRGRESESGYVVAEEVEVSGTGR